MRKIIAVGGRPGTGKTSLFREFMKGFDWEPVTPKKTLSAMYCKELDLYVLGKYEEGEVFAGTDRLSMSVQPMAQEFVSETTSNVLFEGDRIFNQSFLEYVMNLQGVDLQVLFLQTSDNTLQERYIERGSNQSEKFLKGRETKYNNLLSNFELRMVSTDYVNETLSDRAEIIERLNSELLP